MRRSIIIFQLSNRLGRIETLGASLRAIQNRVTAAKAEWVLEIVEPFAGSLIAAVNDPRVSLQQDGGGGKAVQPPEERSSSGGVI